MLDDRQVVGDEQVASGPVSSWRSCSRLRICDWMETSRAQTGSSQTMKSGLERPGPGRCRSAAAARRRTRAGSGSSPRRAGPRVRSSSRHAVARARAAATMPCTAQRLADDLPTVIRGLRQPTGSWKMICIRRPQLPQLLARPSESTSMPSKTHLPAGGGDQPQDRPADGGLAAAALADQAQRLARAAATKVTPSTALTCPTVLPNTPAADGEPRPQVVDLQQGPSVCGLSGDVSALFTVAALV